MSYYQNHELLLWQTTFRTAQRSNIHPRGGDPSRANMKPEYLAAASTTPIEGLRLSSRAAKGLHYARITTIGEAANLTRHELLILPYIGPGSAEELLKAIDRWVPLDLDPAEDPSLVEPAHESGDELIEVLDLSVRASNGMRYAGIKTIGEAADLTRDELLALRNLGTNTVDEILHKIKTWGLPNPKPTKDLDRADLLEAARETPIQVLDLSVRASNGMRYAGIKTIGEAADLTRDELLALRNLGTNTVDEILHKIKTWSPREKIEPSLLSRLRLLTISFSDRNLAIWSMRRGLRSGLIETMEFTGTHFSISRERVRQISLRVDKRLEQAPTARNVHLLNEATSRITEELGPVQFNFSWSRFRSLVTGIMVNEFGVQKADLTARDIDVMIAASGKYQLVERKEENSYHQETQKWDLWEMSFLKDGLPRLHTDIRGLPRKQDYVFPTAEVHRLIANTGVDYFCHKELIEEHLNLREAFGGYIPQKAPIKELLVILLEGRNRPASALDLREELNMNRSERYIANLLSAEDYFVRTGKKTFGLKKWGLETYEGISEEIAQRIERNGGFTQVAPLIEELHREFEVSKSSIEAYLQSPRFKVRSGHVYLRSPEEIKKVLPDLSLQPDWWWLDRETVRAKLKVDGERLRGSGLSISGYAASALGVQFGEDSTFIAESGEPVTVKWATSAIGPQIGSLKEPIEKAGIPKGTLIFVDFDLSSMTLQIIPILSSPTTELDLVEQMVGLKIDADTNLVSLFSKALGVEADIRIVLDCLYRRKEGDLGSLVEKKGEPGVWPSKNEIHERFISSIPLAKAQTFPLEGTVNGLYLHLDKPFFRTVRAHCFALGFDRLTPGKTYQKGLRVSLPTTDVSGRDVNDGEFLLVGYDHSYNVFVLWDAGVREGSSAYTPHEPVWIGERLIRRAVEKSDGVTCQRLPSGEVIVACKASALEAGLKRRYAENLRRLIGE